MKNKLLFIPALVLTLAGLAVYKTPVASAHMFGDGNQSFAQSLAAKLGIGEDKVQEALSSIREEHHAQMQTRFEERLNQAVTDKKLTEEQKNKILAKHKEIVAQKKEFMENSQDLSPEEHRAQMQKFHDELTRWAEGNDIDMQYLFGLTGGKKGFGFRHMM